MLSRLRSFHKNGICGYEAGIRATIFDVYIYTGSVIVPAGYYRIDVWNICIIVIYNHIRVCRAVKRFYGCPAFQIRRFLENDLRYTDLIGRYISADLKPDLNVICLIRVQICAITVYVFAVSQWLHFSVSGGSKQSCQHDDDGYNSKCSFFH